MADPDAPIRVAAFAKLRSLVVAHGGPLPWAAVHAGFAASGHLFHFASAAGGIFRPRGMRGLLSVKTVVPNSRGRVWYADQVDAGGPRPAADVMYYAFTGTDPSDVRNQWLKDAMERRLPIIYFYGVSPAAYEPLFPVFVEEWDPSALRVSLAVSAPLSNGVADLAPPDQAMRRYALRLAQRRLHQAVFREQVADAYGRRCALSGLPELRLLDAAHIVPDGDEAFGQPDVRNGILMTRLHHSAYDAGLLGIDSDYRVHVSDGLLSMQDGPMLEIIKALHGHLIRTPRDPKFQPDRDRLAMRFREFLQTC